MFTTQTCSPESVLANWLSRRVRNSAVSSASTASIACVRAWHEDFRDDVAKIDVTALIIQGDADRVVPTPPADRGWPR